MTTFVRMTSFSMWTLLLAVVLCASAGCQSTHKDLVSFLKAHEHEVSAIEYRVGIPDAVRISAPQVLEIDQTALTIRPDGKIPLRLLGPVKVVGLTEKEIAAKLRRLLLPYYEDPKVQVDVAGYMSKRIYLSGQVGGGGNYGGGGGGGGGGGFSGGGGVSEAFTSIPYTGRDSVLDILANQGMSFIAWRSQVRVIRSSPNADERREIVIDVDHMMKTGDTSANVLLQPNDILHVPATPLGWLGLRIQEVLFPFQPIVNAYSFPAQVYGLKGAYGNDDDD